VTTFKRNAVIGINRINSTYGNIHSVPVMLLTNYLLTVSHFGSALDITLILLLYYYSILPKILSETMYGCYLHMLCFLFRCFCVSCSFWRI